MRKAIAAILCTCMTMPVASADPDPLDHPPPAVPDEPTVPEVEPPPAPPPPAAVPPVITPPITTISTMPVSHTIPGYWDSSAKTDAWIATGVTVALTTAAMVWWVHRNKYAYGHRGATCIPDFEGSPPTDIRQCWVVNVPYENAVNHRQTIWKATELGIGVLTGVSLMVTTKLWANHYHDSHTMIGAAPTSGGGQLSVFGSF